MKKRTHEKEREDIMSNKKVKRRRRLAKAGGTDLNKQVMGRSCDVRVGAPVGEVRVVFQNIASELCHLIRSAHTVVGAIAWLTDKDVLQCMAERKGGVRIAITNDTVRKDVREAYKRLKRADVDIGGEGKGGAVVKVGERQGRMRPLMHHKFMIGVGCCGQYLWCTTGSSNMTANSRKSMENMVIFTDPGVCKAFHEECKAIFASSACKPV